MKAIIFDMDGVLVNTEPLHYKCWKEVVKEDGIDLEFNVYKACIGATRDVLLDILKDHYGKVYACLLYTSDAADEDSPV